MTDRFSYSTPLGREVGQRVEALLADEILHLSDGICLAAKPDTAAIAVDYAKRIGTIRAYRKILSDIQEVEKTYHEQRFTDRQPTPTPTAG